MQLICLWIEDYKCLKKMSIVFSPKYKLKGFELVTCENVLDIYGSFYDITAFVGENGSGKSTLLEVIALLLDGQEEEISATLVVEQDGVLKSIGYEEKFKFNRSYIKRAENLIKRKCKTLFYSPVYNPHSSFPMLKKNGVINVSSDAKYSFTRKKNIEIDIKLQFRFLEQMEHFSREHLGFDRYLEIKIDDFDLSVIKKKIFKFFISGLNENVRKNQKDKTYKIIRSVRNDKFVKIFKIIENSFDLDDRSYASKEIKKEIDFLFDDVVNISKNEMHRLHLKDQVRMNFFLRCLASALPNTFSDFYSVDQYDIPEVLNIAVELFSASSVKHWYKSNFEKLGEIAALSRVKNFADFIEDSERFLNLIDNNKSNKFPITFTPEQAEDAMYVISGIRKMNLFKYGVRFGWKGVSSGQIAKMNLYSRIYSALSEDNLESVLLLLDEADIYLHPEWQRKFVFDLSEFFKELKKHYGKNFNVSLVLTTHSPLMISDLMKDDVYILSINQKGVRKIKNADRETFGANIHQLYKDEFVILSPKGEMAELSISRIISEIKKNPNSEQREKLKATLSIIGDPLVRIGLNNMLEGM
jgi:AAA15 family ATPase/GTPase